MSVRSIRRQAVNPGAYSGTANAAPIYVDSDDNILKMIPAGSGTTEVQVLDASSTQTLTNKTLTTPTINNAHASVSSPMFDSAEQVALTDTATVTAAQLIKRVLDGTPTAAATYTLPTAALLVAGITGAKVGDSFVFVVNNKSAGANTITVAAGVGGTGDGTLTVAQNVVRAFIVIVTNVTAASEAYFVYGIE